MFEFEYLNISYLYELVTFLFKFMSDQRDRIHRVREKKK